MPHALFWSALGVVAMTGLAGRLLAGRPLFGRRAASLGRADLVVALVALLALGFHCAAMFFRGVALAVPGTNGAVTAINELGTVSQIAFWLPALLLVLALRRAWAPLLVVQAGALTAVGVTMFWDYGLPVHLGAIAVALVLTVTVLTSVAPQQTQRRQLA